MLARLRPYLVTAAGARADSVEQGLRLRECQETLVSLTILAKKYKDLFWRVQMAAAAPQPQVLQAGWLTFLLLKAQLLQQYPDLVRCGWRAVAHAPRPGSAPWAACTCMQQHFRT